MGIEIQEERGYMAPEDEGIKNLRNVGNDSPKDTASHLRRLKPESQSLK
jgi:hypothetical protein